MGDATYRRQERCGAVVDALPGCNHNGTWTTHVCVREAGHEMGGPGLGRPWRHQCGCGATWRPTDTIDKLIERSSLGTPGAKALRERTPPEVVDRIMRKVEERTEVASTPERAEGATSSRSANAPIGPDLNYDDFLSLGERTTSNGATRKKVAELLADAKFRDNWELAIWPGITTTKIDVWKVGGSEPAFTVIFAPGTPIEIYDSGRRCGTRVTVTNAAERVARGWWK